MSAMLVCILALGACAGVLAGLSASAAGLVGGRYSWLAAAAQACRPKP